MKSWAGRVYGKGTDRRWTVVLGQRKYQPENPILQNKVHIRSLQALLGEEIPMHNIVVLSSRADLRLKDVTNAFVIRPREVARTITALKNEVLSDAQAQGIYQRLTAANITDKTARKRHVQTIRQRRK
ncbi:MAG: NERD domain-containing protein [Alicyclobacillus sp.]|nr:NERD domain-containing protein [Alicyclobacillus sp.]